MQACHLTIVSCLSKGCYDWLLTNTMTRLKLCHITALFDVSLETNKHQNVMRCKHPMLDSKQKWEWIYRAIIYLVVCQPRLKKKFWLTVGKVMSYIQWVHCPADNSSITCHMSILYKKCSTVLLNKCKVCISKSLFDDHYTWRNCLSKVPVEISMLLEHRT